MLPNKIITPQQVLFFTPQDLKINFQVPDSTILSVQQARLIRYIGNNLYRLMLADLVTAKWNAATPYTTGDAVIGPSGFPFVALQGSTGSVPPAFPNKPTADWAYQAQFTTERFRDLWDMGLGELLGCWVISASLPFMQAQLNSSGVQYFDGDKSRSAGAGAGGWGDSINNRIKEIDTGLQIWLNFIVEPDPAPITNYPEWETRTTGAAVSHGMVFDNDLGYRRSSDWPYGINGSWI